MMVLLLSSENLDDIVRRLLETDPTKVESRLISYTQLIALYFNNLSITKHSENYIELSYELDVDCSEGRKKLTNRYIEQKITINVLKDPMGVKSWVKIRAPIIKIDKIKPEQRGKLFEDLLRANYKVHEFAFDICDDNYIGVTEDIYIPALTFDVFVEEFNAVLRAISYFYDNIATKYDVEVECKEKGDISQLYD